MNKEECEKEFIRLANFAAEVPISILAIPSGIEETCDVCGGTDDEDPCEYSSSENGHLLGCPMNPNHPPYL
jgi:hypothetical protein